MDDLIHVGPPKLGLQQLEPLDSIRAETNPALIEAGIHPPPAEVGNWPPQAEAGSELPQGVWLTRREKELVMARRGMNNRSKRLEEKQANAKALHT